MMPLETALHISQLLLAGITAGGLTYLVYSGRFAVGYATFFRTIIVGLILFIISGLIVGYVQPSWRHAVHMIATLAVTGGLYELVISDVADPDRGFLLLDEK